VGAERNLPDEIQSCFAGARFKQARQRFKKVALAKISEPAASLGGIAQINRA
jgi:hypothetical protein